MSIGETLARARGQAGLTVSQVSELTRIRETIISGIERDDYGACGGDFYARGHIRAIAQVVGADSEPLIREYDSSRPEPEPIPPVQMPEPAAPGTAPPRRVIVLATAALALVVAAGLAIYLLSGLGHGSAAKHGAGPAPGRNTGAAALGGGTGPTASKIVIHLTAKAGCQVDFTTPTGLLLLRSSVAAGTSKTWTFHRALKMKIGNPGGVTLTVDGKNPLPAGLGAQPVTLSIGSNHVVKLMSPAPVTGQVRVLHPVRATAFGPGDNGAGDNGQFASRVIDGNPGTAWHTDWYATADFGGLKPGTGVLLDMGRTVTVTAARVSLGSTGGAAFQLRVGATPTLAGLRIVARATGVGGAVQPRLTAPARGRYVLIWLTRLPPDAQGTFQESIFGARLTGRA